MRIEPRPQHEHDHNHRNRNGLPLSGGRMRPDGAAGDDEPDGHGNQAVAHDPLPRRVAEPFP